MPEAIAAPLPELFPPSWYVFMDGAENQSIKGSLDGLLTNAAKAIESMRSIYGDKRFTNKGAAEQTEALAFSFISVSQRDKPYPVKTFIESESSQVLKSFEALAIPDTTIENGAEWREFIRTAGNDERERIVALNELIIDGNEDAIPSILQASPGLSGISKRMHETLRLRVKVAGNVEQFAKLRIRAECLSALTMANIRAVHAVVTAASLPVDKQKQMLLPYSEWSIYPNMAELIRVIEGTEDAIRAFTNHTFIDFNQFEAAPDSASVKPEGEQGVNIDGA
jgi:hypothetical protein